jgi:NTE family protein
MLQGYLRGGRDGARQALDRFWRKVADMAVFSPIRRSYVDKLFRNWNLDSSPAYLFADMFMRLFSPYELNPQNVNPLRDFIHETLDAEAIRAADPFKLYVSATSARTGQIRVFDRHEITADVFLASACLPFAFHAVEINGEPYWDGGYMGNPALFPLIANCSSDDIVIVQINPLVRDQPLRTASEILNRLNEITMNASLRHELQFIALMQELIDSGRLSGDTAKNLRSTRIHMIAAAETMASLGVASKSNGEIEFLEYLRDVGRTCADVWLKENFDLLGQQSSVNLEEAFLRGLSRRFQQPPPAQGQPAGPNKKASR